MSKAIQKKAKQSLPSLFQIGDLKVKPMFLADMGDGAFTDDCVKVKPHKSGTGMVLKCVSRARLEKALQKAGFAPDKVKVVKGRKHFIAMLGEEVGMSPALSAPDQKQIGGGK